jgi:hypothetical protein
MKWSPCYKEVTCKDCKETYICVPAKDYYDSTNNKDGVCYDCLIAGHEGTFVIESYPAN